MKTALLKFLHTSGALVGSTTAIVGSLLPVLQIISPKTAVSVVAAGSILAAVGKGLSSLEAAVTVP